ncbi:DUF5819 family protein [Streptomyces sp. NRRL WC-3549]|uniref:DUF5819 family protein n=1 Tax=Streptomyces sp. NRRL WC-3549 TaxID=1463925 RepID=UPI0004C7916B|nr:DUF5819 family protein [Streptomyces sp. NRRL WC-3549]
MDADHGGRAAGEREPVWPKVTAPPPAGLQASRGPDTGDPSTHIPGARPESSPEADPAGDDGTAAFPRSASEAQGQSAPAGPGPGGGIAALSLPYQVVAALALSVIALLACGHLAMVFLHVAPANTLTKQHGEAVDDWIYPEFEQNWKLFAPNPLQQNIAVHVRAEVAGADGRHTTRWMSLSHEDGKAIRGNLLPSHVHQNELRRAWDFYTGSHDDENRPNGLRGELSERYIRRIVMLRLSEHDYGGTVERVQIRSAVTAVGAPAWSDEKVNTQATYRMLPWWTVTPADLPGGPERERTSAGAEVAE